MLITMNDVEGIHGIFTIDNETKTTESVYLINSSLGNVTIYEDLRFYKSLQCLFNLEIRISQNESTTTVLIRLEEASDPLSEDPSKTTCLPSKLTHLIITGDSD